MMITENLEHVVQGEIVIETTNKANKYYSAECANKVMK